MNTTRQILATKIHMPSLTTRLVARPRLIDRLNAVLHCPLTTVIAPTGFGKTTMVCTWVASVAAEGAALVAWLTLEPNDDDLPRFWTAVVTALQIIDPDLGSEVLALLSTTTPSSPDDFLTPFINQLAEHTASPIVLVLDDYHIVNAPAIHAALTFVVDHLPPHMHLVLISRSDPPLPLARLRARGQLAELRAADLRFVLEESAVFLNNIMGLQLPLDTITALEERTEGWVAGLHLAALSMQNRTDRDGFVRSLTGGHRYIMDYLVEEILERQPTMIRNFLLKTAILDRLCVPLCNAVIGNSESATALKAVERANLFLISLDDVQHWYRYHHLFVEMLRVRLAQEQPTLISELHLRASAWYADNAAGEIDMQGEAIRHALAADDGDLAAHLIDEMMDTLWVRTELTTLRAWLTSLPTYVLHAHPRQAITLAQLLLLNGSLNDVPPLLDAATAALGPNTLPANEQAALRGRIVAIRSHVIRNAERLGEAIALAEQALVLLPDSERTGRALAALGLAIAHHMQGMLPVADASYRDTIALCEAVGDRYFEITTRCMHSRLMLERGNLFGAETAFQYALQRATLGAQRLPIAGWALIGLGTVAYTRNDLQNAETLLVEGLALARRGGLRNPVIHGGAGLVRLRLAQGDLDSAREAASQFILDTQAGQIPHFIRWAAAIQALVDLHCGDLSAATRWAHTSQPRPDALMFTDKACFAVYVRVLLAMGQIDKAQRCIAEQRVYIAPFDHVETQIELHLLDTAALIEGREWDAARASLVSALALAEPVGLTRLFLDAGESVMALLTQRPQEGSLGVFVARSLNPSSGFGLGERSPSPIQKRKSQDQAVIEPLSDRELEVLRLMAAGLSNQAIADHLIISVPTVKKHGSNIFGKLYAANRTEAVARARELGLLP